MREAIAARNKEEFNMGRGNICTHEEFEGLYYLDNERFSVYRKSDRYELEDDFDYDEELKMEYELREEDISYNFDGSGADYMYDALETQLEWDDMIESMREAISEKFPEFSETDRWRESNKHVILESDLFDIAVADNEWSAAWMLLQSEDLWDTEEEKEEMREKSGAYLDAIKNALLELYGECFEYGGAWTCGEKLVREAAASVGTEYVEYVA
jgi:hypothetical protein